MTENPTRRRMTRVERAQRLYTARADEYEAQPYEEKTTQTAADYLSNGEEQPFEAYQPNEETAFEPVYVPNEEQDDCADYAPNEESAAVDYTAYYSREGAEQDPQTQPAFAPPPSMQRYMTDAQLQDSAAQEDEYGYSASNVYRPRQVTWAEEERPETLDESRMGYQVAEDHAPARRKKRHPARTLLSILLILVLLGGAAWMLRDTLAQMLGLDDLNAQPSDEPLTAMVTPVPVKPYEAAPAAVMGDNARRNIAQLSGTLEMENYLVTDQHIVTRNRRANGTYDFYLFTSEGRLLCYFEGLGALDMMPQDFGGFYVNQEPWLVAANGSALVRTVSVEAAIGESVFLHPMYHGWAVVESETDGQANYVNADGQLLSTLWFSRTFPFTDSYTLAYVDTGSTASTEQRYLLYMLDENGGMTRWLAAADMDDVVACVGGIAYMSDGAFYRLPDTSAPAGTTPEMTAYVDCDAMVIKDPASGKYGLFVNGEQLYDFAYDSIKPLKSDLVWAECNTGSASARLAIKAVSGASEAHPLSCSFELEKNGKSEYVALSVTTSCPIRVDGDF